MKKRVLVRGGGDLSSAVIQKLYRCGFDVLVCELPSPKVVRRTVAYSNAVYEGSYTVEGIEAVLIAKVDEIEICLNKRQIPVSILPESELMAYFEPDIFVDTTLSKKKVNYDINYASTVIGIGPTIEAGVDAHVVIETCRGHDLGRLIFEGFAKENTHVPGSIEGFTHERVLRAPCDGVMKTSFRIGDFVEKGETVVTVGDMPVKAEISGVLRGLIHGSVTITKGLKVGDIDPRGNTHYCFTISDKGRNIAGGVLEAIYVRELKG